MRTLLSAVLSLLLGIAVLAAIACWAVPVRAQEHRHPIQDSDLRRDFYSKWRQLPTRSVSCCNLEDCYPTAIKFEDGKWYALRREDGRWLFIPDGKLEQNQEPGNIVESPDFQSHACIQKPGIGDVVYCATLGAGN